MKKSSEFKEVEHKIDRSDFVGMHNANSFAVAVDGHGKLGWNGETMLGDHVISVLTEAVKDSYLAHLQEIGVSYIFGGKTSIDLSHFQLTRPILKEKNPPKNFMT